MTEDPIDHRSIAVQTFNDTWELISKQDRSDAQTEEMIHMAHASAWHWSRVEARTPINLAVAAWQLSRVYALAGSPERSRHYGQQSLDLALEHGLGAHTSWRTGMRRSPGLPPQEDNETPASAMSRRPGPRPTGSSPTSTGGRSSTT